MPTEGESSLAVLIPCIFQHLFLYFFSPRGTIPTSLLIKNLIDLVSDGCPLHLCITLCTLFPFLALAMFDEVILFLLYRTVCNAIQSFLKVLTINFTYIIH